MFKRTLATHTKQVVGNKDRKLLKKQLQQKFSDQPTSVINFLVPELLWVIKGVQGLKSVIYYSEKGPLFFDYDGSGEYFPTLLSLSQFPQLLPSFVIYSPASSYILKGANVMLPSVIRPVSSTNDCYCGGLQENKRMSVRVYGNPIPFCVGLCLVNENSFFQQKGKALKVLHMFGDQLCVSMGSALPPLDGFSPTLITPTTPPTPENTEWYQKQEFLLNNNLTNNVVEYEQHKTEETAFPVFEQDDELLDEEDDGESVAERELDEKTSQEHETISKNKADSEKSTFSSKDGKNLNKNNDYEWNDEEEENGEENEKEDGAEDEAEEDNFARNSNKLLEDGKAPSPKIFLNQNESKVEPSKNIDEKKEIEENTEEEKKKMVCSDENEARGIGLVSAPEMDKFLELVLLQVLHTELPDSACPISISAVFSKMTQRVSDVYEHPECKKLVQHMFSSDSKEFSSCDISSILPLDLKKSSYKKLTKFFQHYSKQNLLGLKKVRGEDLVVSVRRESQLYKQFKVVAVSNKKDRSEDGVPGNSKSSQQQNFSSSKSLKSGTMPQLVIIDCYQPKSSAASTILEGVAPQIQSAYYSLEQCRSAILNYVDVNQLTVHNDVNSATLDSNLAQICMTKVDRKKLSEEKHLSFDTVTMPIDSICSKFIESLAAFHGVCKEGATTMSIYKDKLKPIEITLEIRQRRRSVTLIKNYHSFNVDEKLFTEILQKSLASSANTFLIPGTTKKGVMVQGSFVNEVKKILLMQFNVPPQYILTP